MHKPLLLFVGKSASGKTTIANLLEKEGYVQVQSYTTRPPRYEGETGHIFVSGEEFDNLGQLAAYTLYNGRKYGTTVKQVDECDIYVIDVPGVKTLLKNYKTKRPIYIIYFDADVHTRINRMIDRGSHDDEIVSRLLTDEKYDWVKKLRNIILYDSHEKQNVRLYIVDANQNKADVVDAVKWYIK